MKMARNPNPALPNRHCIYLATSGAGKSQAIKQNKDIPAKGVRHVFFDPDEDHKVNFRARTVAAFKEALIKGMKSKKGFRIAYSGDNSKTNFDTWCDLVWAALDGNNILYISIEELSASVDSSGNARGRFAQLLRQSRKYGGVMGLAAQRSTEVPKTAYTQCKYKYIGMQDEYDLPMVAKRAGIKPELIKQLQPLQFLVKEPGQEPTLVKLKYKK